MVGKAVGTGAGNKGSGIGMAAEREEEMAEMVGQSHNGTTRLHRRKTDDRLLGRDIWSISRTDANHQKQLDFTST